MAPFASKKLVAAAASAAPALPLKMVICNSIAAGRYYDLQLNRHVFTAPPVPSASYGMLEIHSVVEIDELLAKIITAKVKESCAAYYVRSPR